MHADEGRLSHIGGKETPVKPIDKRYHLDVSGHKTTVIAGTITEAITVAIHQRSPHRYKLTIERWPNDPNMYTVSSEGDRLGMVTVLKIDE